MKLTIEIDMDNDSFSDERGDDRLRESEVRQILGTVARRLGSLREVDRVSLRDSNGNRVGFAEVTED